MVRGKEDDVYRLMKLQFDELCKKQEYIEDDFLAILSKFKEGGIKKAADHFYNRKNVRTDG
jgi:hypothetical protein